MLISTLRFNGTTSMPLDLFLIEHNIDDTSREVMGAKKNEFGTSTGKYATWSLSLQAGNESAMPLPTDAKYSLKNITNFLMISNNIIVNN